MHYLSLCFELHHQMRYTLNCSSSGAVTTALILLPCNESSGLVNTCPLSGLVSAWSGLGLKVKGEKKKKTWMGKVWGKPHKSHDLQTPPQFERRWIAYDLPTSGDLVQVIGDRTVRNHVLELIRIMFALILRPNHLLRNKSPKNALLQPLKVSMRSLSILSYTSNTPFKSRYGSDKYRIDSGKSQ